MIESLIRWWQGLGRRERRMLSAMLAVLALAALDLLAYEPAARGVAALTDQLPQMRRDLVQMQALALEAGDLSQASATQTSVAALRSRIEASMQSVGISPFVADLQTQGSRIELKFAQVPFDRWVLWLETLLHDSQLRVIMVSVQREPDAGRVSVRLALQGPRAPDKP
jgi:general secretion pathway protein M